MRRGERSYIHVRSLRRQTSFGLGFEAAGQLAGIHRRLRLANVGSETLTEESMCPQLSTLLQVPFEKSQSSVARLAAPVGVA